jgi:tRNA-dihydrouridine synthase 4
MPAMPQASVEDASDDLPPVETLSPAEMLRQFPQINIAAPMVRYSKLPFRQLVTEMGNVHITHTPMLLAKEFANSPMAREADFSTNDAERGVFHLQDDGLLVSERLAAPTWPTRRVRGGLIAQFAANDSEYLSSAVELIKPYVDAVDINCGCPQRWAYKEGIGSFLLRSPETVSGMVKSVKARVEGIPVHVKIRVDPDLKCVCSCLLLTLTSRQIHRATHPHRHHGRRRLHLGARPDPTYDIGCTPRLARADRFRSRSGERRGADRRERGRLYAGGCAKDEGRVWREWSHECEGAFGEPGAWLLFLGNETECCAGIVYRRF